MNLIESYHITPVKNGIVLTIHRLPDHLIYSEENMVDRIVDRFAPFVEKVINTKSGEDMKESFKQVIEEREELPKIPTSEQMVFPSYKELDQFLQSKLN